MLNEKLIHALSQFIDAFTVNQNYVVNQLLFVQWLAIRLKKKYVCKTDYYIVKKKPKTLRITVKKKFMNYPRS